MEKCCVPLGAKGQTPCTLQNEAYECSPSRGMCSVIVIFRLSDCLCIKHQFKNCNNRFLFMGTLDGLRKCIAQDDLRFLSQLNNIIMPKRNDVEYLLVCYRGQDCSL